MSIPSVNTDIYITETDTRAITPTHKHHNSSSPCIIQSNGELDDISWWSSMPLRYWETQKHEINNNTIEATQSFHLVLIRHAESTNNQLTDIMFDKLHITTQLHTNNNNNYNNEHKTNDDINTLNHEDLMNQYNLKRSTDPDLSALGYQQSIQLIQHQLFHTINLNGLISQNRIKFICSPMRRAMLTSVPLLKHYNITATVDVDYTERGGAFNTVYDNMTQQYMNTAVAGRSRSEMEHEFSSTHNCDAVPETGWWTQHCTITDDVEGDELFYIRLERIVKQLKSTCKQYAINYRQSIQNKSINIQPDFYFVMCHGDLIDELLSRLLGCTARRYVFYTSNTAAAHVELIYMGTVNGEDKIEARIRGTNIQPNKI